MSAIFKNAQNGDTNAFAEIYAEIYTKLYYLAYYSLAGTEEAVAAVKTAAKSAYSDIKNCKNEGEFNSLFLQRLCENIITRFRDYRCNPPKYDPNPSYIKVQMKRLTDAERFTVTIWSLFGINAKEIARFSGLSETVVESKLSSAKAKLESKL